MDIGAVKADEHEDEKSDSFESLGLRSELVEACSLVKWKSPTPIQKEAIPLALQGKDIIGLAETGSGKTGAFTLPLLHSLLENPQRLFGLILTPTRELAFQIAEQIEALGSGIGVKCAVIVGGIDKTSQAITLAKKPHVIIATPGRLVDHLENTKGFSLRALKYLIMDEADRILNMDFEEEVEKILKVIPRQRRTLLFSATMTGRVEKLQRASLVDPVKVQVSSKYEKVNKLLDYYIFEPFKHKDLYLVHLLNEAAGQSVMVFCATCSGVLRVSLLLRNLGIPAVPLHGKLSQDKRLAALNKFKCRSRTVLIATDVASRGLDIPHVDLVINYNCPTNAKDYTHRVGRTARAGRSGKAISLVDQYEALIYKPMEVKLGRQLPLYPIDKSEVFCLVERVAEAQRLANMELRELEDKGLGGSRHGKKRKRNASQPEDSESSRGVRNRI